MNSLLSFLSSSILSNILAAVALVLAFLPQKDTVSIDNSQNYYFEKTSSVKSTNDSYGESFIALTVFLLTYIVYAFLQPYFPIFLLLLSLAVIIRYRFLKIAYKNQMIIPATLVILASFSHYFLPTEVVEYWTNAYKIDFNQIGTFSQVLDQLSAPVRELINLFFSLTTNPLSVAIFSNMLFVILATLSMITDLIKPKYKIKVTKVSALIPLFILLLVIISFMFFTVPNSPARIVVDGIKKFFQPN